MSLFGGKKAEALPVAGGRNPLEAVPVAADGVEAREDELSLIQLRKEVQYRPGFLGALAAKLRLHRNARVNLDEKGTYFWRQIDGKRKLDEIARKLARKYEMTEDESRKATLMFTKLLMLRHLIYLQITPE